MEVDGGMMREISGDDEAVRIVSRDKGDKIIINSEQNQREVVENDLNLDDRVILDPKRKRIEEDLQENAIDQESMQGFEFLRHLRGTGRFAV
ncbi:hypothetical protein ACET3Z_009201 [Daucus carota]